MIAFCFSITMVSATSTLFSSDSCAASHVRAAIMVGMNTQYWFGKSDCHASGVIAASSIAANATAVIKRDLYLYVVVIVDTIQDKKNFLVNFYKKKFG